MRTCPACGASLEHRRSITRWCDWRCRTADERRRLEQIRGKQAPLRDESPLDQAERDHVITTLTRIIGPTRTVGYILDWHPDWVQRAGP